MLCFWASAVNTATNPQGRGRRKGDGGRRRKCKREVVPRPGKQLVSTWVFTVHTHVMFRNGVCTCASLWAGAECAHAHCTHQPAGERSFARSTAERVRQTSVNSAAPAPLPALTFEAIIQLVQLTVLCLPLPRNQVVSDVAVGVRRRFPLQDDLGWGVGNGDGVQGDRRIWKGERKQVHCEEGASCPTVT